jgi:hypothetical protein
LGARFLNTAGTILPEATSALLFQRIKTFVAALEVLLNKGGVKE